MKLLPPQSKLIELFDYSEDLIWKKARPHLIGKVAGVVHYNGYRQVKIAGSYYLAHRLVWNYVTGEDPAENQIDHIDRNRLNNKFDNLRLVTPKQNQANRTGIKGIYRADSKRNPWLANYRGKHLGVFKTKELAQQAYLEAYNLDAGVFANSNRLFQDH